MSVIHAPESRPLHPRMLLFPGLLVVVLGSYFTRLWFLQIVSADDMRERADTTGQIPVKKLAPRGKIFDRSGIVLGGVHPTLVVTAKPKIALQNQDAIDQVAAILAIEPKVLTKAIKKVSDSGELSVPVYVDADVAAATQIAEMVDVLPGFGVETQGMRYYSEPYETGHIMGYVRVPGQKDLERLKGRGIKFPSQYVGIAGIEREYEGLLMGSPGTETIAVDARRRPLRSLGNNEPIPGSSLILSLDSKLQRIALDLLKGRRGSVVALDPRNGEVLCLASSPTYDSSMFLKGISKDDYAELQNDPAKPLFFRAIGAAYAPGSIFKIVTTFASWISGKFSESMQTYCPGFVKVGNRKVKCLGTHQSISYDLAFTKSCNAYFGHLATLSGREALLKACQESGIGSPTGIDIPGESKGILPTPEWWAKNRDRRWALGDTVNFGIGQGELAVTPLQMANVMAIVANGGVRYKPHLLKAMLGPKEGDKVQPYKPEIAGKVEGTSEQWHSLTRALLHVIEYGTAKSARIAQLEWGGKTGSAENKRDHETHSWFVGMAPVESPEIVICVMVENAGHGGEVAAPIAANVVKYWMIDRKKKDQPEANIASIP